MNQMMGCLDLPDVLESLVADHRWLHVAEYLQNALAYHHRAAQAAIAYPDEAPAHDDMLRAHPELFVLPRRQHCLELLGEGQWEQAQYYFDDHIFAPTRHTRRTRYLDDLIAHLQGMTSRNEAPENLAKERHETARSIQDYLRLYFPGFDRGPEVEASKARSREPLCSTAAFGELIKGHNFRCLVCHQPLTLLNDANNRMVLHLHSYCPNMTPAVRCRLPSRNRPPWSDP
ncbi:hypothetical protein BS78_06G023000 [Paspalum vaginatum]|nr:hypothetical protein BS78_06G023000 [Paspalum vaginatum]